MVHQQLYDLWSDAAPWQVGRYVLMPDHLHLFCAPVPDTIVALDDWVGFWKSRFRLSSRQREWVWQTGHWDSRLRRSESYDQKWEYVRSNPVRAGLVESPDQWPWQGEIHLLRW